MEFVTTRGGEAPAAGPDWPRAPGAALRDAAGRALLLHIAPGRWLAPDPDAALLTRLETLARTGAGHLVDVTGKWRALALREPDAARLVASGIPASLVLAGRECATVWMFDCPVVLARAATGFDLWIQSSYAASFAAMLESLRARSRA